MKLPPAKINFSFILPVILSVVGLSDSSYLTASHFADKSVVCLSENSCDAVLQSSYASIGKMPISAMGAGFYLLLFLISVYLLIRPDAQIAKLGKYLGLAGVVVSAYLIYLQLFVIRQICYYCLLSAFTVFSLFLAGLYNERRILEKTSEKPFARSPRLFQERL